MIQDAHTLWDLGKVAHVQPYLPGEYGSPARQPFILVIQDQWMLEMCERLSIKILWAIDSRFKTKQFRLALYAIVAPNTMGIGIPLWYMICSSEKRSNHEQDALETCLGVIFARMQNVRANAIVIIKVGHCPGHPWLVGRLGRDLQGLGLGSRWGRRFCVYGLWLFSFRPTLSSDSTASTFISSNKPKVSNQLAPRPSWR